MRRAEAVDIRVGVGIGRVVEGAGAKPQFSQRPREIAPLGMVASAVRLSRVAVNEVKVRGEMGAC